MSIVSLLGDYAISFQRVKEGYDVIILQKFASLLPLLADDATKDAAIAEIDAISVAYSSFIISVENAENA